MNITVAIPSLDTAVKRQLSVIGKRATVHDASPSEQKPSFYDITPSSAEDDTLHDFYTDAIVLLNTTSQYFITASTAPTPADPSTGSSASASGVVTLSFPTNHNYAMNTTITVAFTSFLVAYAVYAWLSIVNPALVKRYEEAMREKLQSLIQLIFHKSPPQQGYSYNLPPVINTPNDRITINAGEQMLIAYTLGSDGIDDLQITSTVPASVVVSKNATSRLFSIYAVPTLADTTMAVVTISRSTTSTTLATIRVTALPVPEIVPADLPPVLLGYNPTSDSVNIVNGQTLSINYVGTITDAVTSDDDVAVVTVTPSLSDPTTGTISILTNGVGNATITFYNDNGWSYILYTGVSAVQGTSPVINVSSPVSAVAGDTIVIPYTLGTDGYDDLVATIIGQAPEGTVTISKTGGATSGTFTITGVQAGVATISITSTRHPESNTSFSAIITQSHTSEPVIYGYAPGAVINTTEGDDVIEIDYYPGSEGNMVVAASVAVGSPEDYVDIVQSGDYVLVTPLAAGNVSLIFTNSAMSFQQTLTFAIAARPAVVTKPVIYWPNDLYLIEGGATAQVNYVLGNDGVDSVTMTSSDTSILTIAKTSAAQGSTQGTFTITSVAAGTANIHIVDETHGIDEYHTVFVNWVEPQVEDYVYNDYAYLPQKYVSGDPQIGVNTLALTFREASSGTTSWSAVPSESVNISVASTSTEVVDGVTFIVKTLNIKGLQDGITYIYLTNGSWEFRMQLGVGDTGQIDPGGQSSPELSFTANSYTATSQDTSNKPTLINRYGVEIRYSSSNPAVATVDQTTGALTLISDGQTYIQATSVATQSYYSQTVFYSLGVNIQEPVTITELNPPYEDPVTLYYRTTSLLGLTNPIYILDGNELYPCFEEDAQTEDVYHAYCYDAINNTVYLNTNVDLTEVNIATLGQACAESINVKSAYHVYYIQGSGGSTPGTPEYYVLTNASGVGEYSVGNVGLAFLDDTVAGVANPVFYIDNSGVNLCYITNNGTDYFVTYNELTRTYSAATSVTYDNTNRAEIIHDILESLSSRYHRSTSAGMDLQMQGGQVKYYLLPAAPAAPIEYNSSYGSGIIYYKGSISVGGTTLTNPVLDLDTVNGNIVLGVLEESDPDYGTSTYFISYNESTGVYNKVTTVAYSTANRTTVLNAAISALFSAYGVTVSAGSTDTASPGNPQYYIMPGSTPSIPAWSSGDTGIGFVDGSITVSTGSSFTYSDVMFEVLSNNTVRVKLYADGNLYYTYKYNKSTGSITQGDYIGYGSDYQRVTALCDEICSIMHLSAASPKYDSTTAPTSPSFYINNQ